MATRIDDEEPTEEDLLEAEELLAELKYLMGSAYVNALAGMGAVCLVLGILIHPAYPDALNPLAYTHPPLWLDLLISALVAFVLFLIAKRVLPRAKYELEPVDD